MTLFRNFLKITFALLCITFFFLFVPTSFVQTRQSSPVVVTSLPGYSDNDKRVLGVSDETKDYGEIEKDTGCGCGDRDSSLEEVGEKVEDQELVGEHKKGGICVLTEEIKTSDYSVYRSGEKVIVEIVDESNDQAIRDAYRFVQKQDCVVANSNLEWVF